MSKIAFALNYSFNPTTANGDNLNFLENVISEVDKALRTVFPQALRNPHRPTPGASLPAPSLSKAERQKTIGLMRVNHAGEVCAQALYQGQALTAKLEHVRLQMDHAASEEVDHLAWCEARLQELDGQLSKLNVFWYAGSFILGAMAGFAGDRISLGFVAETERQVAAHLEAHLEKLPANDAKSKAILEQMLIDETAHRESALQSGGMQFPLPLQKLMQAVSKVMTQSSYYV